MHGILEGAELMVMRVLRRTIILACIALSFYSYYYFSNVHPDEKTIDHISTTPTLPDHIKKKISESISIDADVYAPASIESHGYDKIYGELIRLDYDNARKNIEKKITNTTFAVVREYVGGISYEDEKTNELVMDDELSYLSTNVNFFSPDYEYISYSIYDNTPALLYKYRAEQNLPGFSISECDKKITECTEAIYGVSDLLVFHRAMDYETRAEYSKVIDLDGSTKEVDRYWNEDDDVYRCMVYQQVNDTPVIDIYSSKAYPNLYDNSVNMAYVSKCGFVSFSFSCFYSLTPTDEKIGLMDFNEIEDIAENHYQNSFHAGDVVISDIRLVSIPVAKKDGTYFKPVWLYSSTDSSDSGGIHFDSPLILFIDASTGEVLG